MTYFPLRKCQKTGIWAWDCIENEPVLLIPMVLALLGDNPMQSEFACHISLKGKLFCRACWVKSTDAQAKIVPQQSDSPRVSSCSSDDEMRSEVSSAGGSDASEETGNPVVSVTSGKKMKGRRKKVLESMSNMVDRVKAFIKVKPTL